jgi:FlaA1/EpsC-like NDP-sugar epimerase
MPARLVERFAQRISLLPRPCKQSIAIAADMVAIPIALFLTLMLKRGTLQDALQVSAWLYLAAGPLCVGIFSACGIYRAVFRFISTRALFSAGLCVLLAAALLAVLDRSLIHSGVSINGFVIFSAFAMLYMTISRTLVRELLYFKRGAKECVAIYGAGAAGAQLARSLRESGQYMPVAFLDADKSLQRTVTTGLKVYAPERLPELIGRQHISSVLLAIPSCSRRQRQAILKSLEPLPVHVRTVPEISDIIAGHATVADVREVDANDVLGRDPVPPNEALLDACIRDKVVMVSGAGGSIGSELCRQIVLLAPRRLVLLEMSEPALYQIDRELRMIASAQKLDVQITALLGNAHHRHRVRDIMQKYSVQTVYHAAAYKHVPIVEQNIIEGIHNNVISSWYAAEAALECGVETFVLISTDKAVNPTNVMGATKRLAELTLQALQERSTVTRFCMVRFGNVLESSGSVVPLFREQIKRGGPVTVTHKDVIRYFMTIPEASQLVLQAGSMAQGGDVFVLDMGEPVRIEDLARRMIHLMGLSVKNETNPDGDIEIVYTGLRPAEKLYEELLISDNVTITEHPMIMRATEPRVAWAQLKHVLDMMLLALDTFDCAMARELLTDTVYGYKPQAGIQDLVWLRGQTTQQQPINIADARARRSARVSVSVSG